MSGEISYLVPSKVVTVEQEIKKSRFISTIGRAENLNKAKDFISEISEKYSDASHNCYAFVAGKPGTPDIGFGDDGEVSGTAGKPMLAILQHKNIGEIVAVVTRYFGGTKLGTGGLVRAYSSSLQLALNELEVEKYEELKTAQVIVSYQNENTIRQILMKLDLSVSKASYNQNVELKFEVKSSQVDQITEELNSKTHGETNIIWLE